MPRLPFISFLNFLLAALLVTTASADAADHHALHVVRSDAQSLIVELRLPAHAAAQTDLPRLQTGENMPALPFLARIFATPPGITPVVRVLDAESVELTDFDLPNAPASDTYLPSERAESEYLGVLRGVETHTLRLFPHSYNGARNTLRVYTRLLVEIRFPGAGASAKTTAPDPLWNPLLNPEQAAAWTQTQAAAKIAQDMWYNPETPWIKLDLDEDGLYRISPDWLNAFANSAAIDPRSFRLFYLGQEQLLHVEGQADGRFDAEDFLLFHGRYRRDDRDFTSLYGRRNTYWVFFLLGIVLYLSVPFTAAQVSVSPSVVWLIYFYAATMIIFTMYGGGFATIPAYLADIFGTKYVGGIHGRLLTAWSTAGVLGPLAITSLRESSVNNAINELVTSIDPAAFQTAFGAGIDQLEALVAQNSVTIARLMEIAPAGTTDPTSGIYNSTMVLMAALLGIALISNALMRPVDPKHHIAENPS